MTMPFDTLKLARRLEAAGFPAASQLATKTDLRDLEQRLTIRFGGMLVAATALILTAVGISAGFLARLIH
jgi:uncharacterized protein GlcG (DUF336 family)